MRLNLDSTSKSRSLIMSSKSEQVSDKFGQCSLLLMVPIARTCSNKVSNLSKSQPHKGDMVAFFCRDGSLPCLTSVVPAKPSNQDQECGPRSLAHPGYSGIFAIIGAFFTLFSKNILLSTSTIFFLISFNNCIPLC